MPLEFWSHVRQPNKPRPSHLLFYAKFLDLKMSARCLTYWVTPCLGIQRAGCQGKQLCVIPTWGAPASWGLGVCSEELIFNTGARVFFIRRYLRKPWDAAGSNCKNTNQQHWSIRWSRTFCLFCGTFVPLSLSSCVAQREDEISLPNSHGGLTSSGNIKL